MVKVYRDNQVLSINETELEYYKSIGYKKVGEKETPKEGVSLTDYNKLMEEKEEIARQLVEVNNTIVSKDEEIQKLTEDLNTANSKIAEQDEEINKVNTELSNANVIIAEKEEEINKLSAGLENKDKANAKGDK